ncbi:MAG: 30S ribosomal protein S11 [Chloroflexi bacterium]|nr:30S ribosomal protein S11 [Chloroflexota bacterium]
MPAAKRTGKRSGRRRERRVTPRARAYIQATFNNTIITFTDPEGNVILWGSPGSLDPPFKGSRRSTPYAAQIAAQNTAKRAMDMGVREVDIYVKGPGPGREAAIRSIQAVGLKVRSITDITPIPHNGCRPPKKRRI